MSLHRLSATASVLALALAGCATVPSGPRIATMPGPNKSFEQFQADQASCREYAQASLGGRTPAENSANSAVGSAVVGSAIGAAAGAILGSISGNAGAGAAWGAGTGLLFGSAAGANAAGYSYAESQRVYDMAYAQCMYARGNDLPGRRVAYRAPPQATYPPPNYPPPNLSSAPPPGSPRAPVYGTTGVPPGPIAPGPAVPAPAAPATTYPPPSTPPPPGIS